MNKVEVKPVTDNDGQKLIKELCFLEEVLDFLELLSQKMCSRSDGVKLQDILREDGNHMCWYAGMGAICGEVGTICSRVGTTCGGIPGIAQGPPICKITLLPTPTAQPFVGTAGGGASC